MVTIRLLGEAGRRFGRRFQLAVKTPAEAVRALSVQIPGLREYMLQSSEAGINWRVITEKAEGLEEEGLFWPLSKRLVLAPIPTGRGGVGKVIAGVALVAVALLLLPGAPLAGALGFSIGGQAVGAAVTLGVGLTFLGVAEMLTPTPKMPNIAATAGGGIISGRSAEDQLKSFTFDKSNANTMQGEVVPVLYGERIIGKLPVLSFGLELQNYL